MGFPCAISIQEIHRKKFLNLVSILFIITAVDSWNIGRVAASFSLSANSDTSVCPERQAMQSLRMSGVAYKVLHFLRHGQAQHNPRAEVNFDSTIFTVSQDPLNSRNSAGRSNERVFVSNISGPDARGRSI